MPAENTPTLPEWVQTIINAIAAAGAFLGGKHGWNWWKTKNSNGAIKGTRKAVEELEKKWEPILMDIATQLRSISVHMERQNQINTEQSRINSERDQTLNQTLRDLNGTINQNTQVLAELKGRLLR